MPESILQWGLSNEILVMIGYILCLFVFLLIYDKKHKSIKAYYFPNGSTGKGKQAGNGVAKNKQKDPSKRHQLFKKRFG